MSDERLCKTLIYQGRGERRTRLRLEAEFLVSGGGAGIWLVDARLARRKNKA